MAVLALAAAGSGCGSLEVVRALDHGVTNDYLNTETRVAIQESDGTLRALRGQFIIVALSRDAKRTIELISDDPASDAARLAARIQIAQKAAERLYVAAQDRVLFNVRRADLVDEAIEISKVAAVPTIRGWRGLLLARNPVDVGEAAIKSFKESLQKGIYKEAYIADLQVVAAETDPARRKALIETTRAALNSRLQDACDELGAMVSSQTRFTCR